MIEQSTYKKLRIGARLILGKFAGLSLQLNDGSFLTMSRLNMFRLFNEIMGRTLILSAAYTLTPADNGKTVFFTSATGFTVTLPPLPYQGYKFKFVIGGPAPTSGNHVVLSATLDDIYGPISDMAGTGDVASAADQVNFVASQAAVGDWVAFDGSLGLAWVVDGGASVAAGITATG